MSDTICLNISCFLINPKGFSFSGITVLHKGHLSFGFSVECVECSKKNYSSFSHLYTSQLSNCIEL
jgi:hypothetical protein